MLKKTFLQMLILFCALLSIGAQNNSWQEYKGRHFLIYYKEAPLGIIKTLEKSAEDYYEEIMLNLGFRRYQGWTWEDRARIYMYDDVEDYQKSSNQFLWSSGSASPSQKVIKTYPAAHGFFDSTLPHELGHIIFREFIGYSVSVPRWFEEGVAMNQEKAKRWGAHKTVKRAIQSGAFIGLTDLGKIRLTNKTSREMINLFYAESASVINYLIEEFGEQRFSRFCREIRDKKNFDRALTTIYTRFRSIEDLNNSWVQQIKR